MVLGVAFENVYGRLFPVVGLGCGASIRADFKKASPGSEKSNDEQDDLGKPLQRRRTSITGSGW